MAFGTTNPTNGISRSWGRFSDAVKEIIDARVASGVHFRTADVQGALIGEKVARQRQNHYFEPA